MGVIRNGYFHKTIFIESEWPMQTFTDDDLKWIKDRIDQPGYERHTKQYKALLARLEAAEKAIGPHYCKLHCGGFGLVSPEDCSACGAYETWRKACGK